MRDTLFHTTQTAYTIGPVGTVGCCWVFPAQTYSGEFLSKSRGRDDVHIGNHLHPLPYFGWHLDGFSDPINVTKKKDCTTPQGESASYLEGVSGRAHCTAMYLLHPYLEERQHPERHFAVVENYDTVSRAHNKLLRKIANGQVNLGETLGEARSTGVMIGTRAVQVLQAWNAVRNGNWGLAASLLGLSRNWTPRNIANAWLELKFGWLPILSEIYNLIEFLKGLLNGGSNIVRAKVRVEENISPFVTSLRYERTGNITYRVESGAIYAVDNPWVVGLNQLGIANPLSILWDLRPLSFVLDWFISVGSFLDGLSATWGLTFVSGYETLSVKSNVALKDWGQLPGWQTPTSFSMVSSGMTRRVRTDFPTPGISIQLGLDFSKFSTLMLLSLQRS